MRPMPTEMRRWIISSLLGPFVDDQGCQWHEGFLAMMYKKGIRLLLFLSVAAWKLRLSSVYVDGGWIRFLAHHRVMMVALRLTHTRAATYRHV